MKRSALAVSLMSTLAVLAFTPTVPAAENKVQELRERIKMSQLPPAVKATVEKESAGAKVDEIEKETENGKTIYEVDIVKNGHATHLHVAEDGKVLSRGTNDDEDED